MYEFLFSNANIPYMGAIAVLLALLVLELGGLVLGFSFMDGTDVDGDMEFNHHIDGDIGGHIGDFFHWVGVGRVPVLMLLAVFTGIFGIIGLTVNQTTTQILGVVFPALFTVPFVFIATLPLLSRASRLIAKYFPRDESNVITVDQLVGLTGTITSGNASDIQIAFARVYDRHGVQHNVRVLSSNGDLINEHSRIRLDSMASDQATFFATKI